MIREEETKNNYNKMIQSGPFSFHISSLSSVGSSVVLITPRSQVRSLQGACLFLGFSFGSYYEEGGKFTVAKCHFDELEGLHF